MKQPDVSNLVTNMPKPLKWVIPDTIRSDHATHLIVQQQGSEFSFLFFEAETVLFSGSHEEQIAAYKELPEIKAKCIAKIVMSAENAALAANNLIESLNKFNSMLLAVRGEENAGTPGNTELSHTS